MRVLIVGNGNIFLMPYLRYYVEALERNGIEYDVVYWDRLNIKETDKSNYIRFTQTTSGVGLESLPGYLNYYRIIKSLFVHRSYDMCIVFTLQMAILLKYLLCNIPYILDIRDFTYEYLPVYRHLEKQLIDGAAMNTISSEGFLEWLPKGRQYAICKNLSFDIHLHNSTPFNSETRNINYIGAIRYLKGNIDFLKVCGKINNLKLNYYGSSQVIDKRIAQYCTAHQISNVTMHGIFRDEEIHHLYAQANFIHSVYGTETANTRSLLPNRLCGACAHKRPVIVSSQTHLADVVSKNGLGIIFDPHDADSFQAQMDWYYARANYALFCNNCETYLAQISREMEKFQIQLQSVLCKHTRNHSRN